MIRLNSNLSKIPVSEIFESIQGEGIFMGYPAIFIRVSGCNLAGKCKECDTDYRFRRWLSEFEFYALWYEAMDNDKILVITGGEPMIYDRLFSKWIKNGSMEHGLSTDVIQFETNGILFPKRIKDYGLSWFVVSPKKGFDFDERWLYTDFTYFKYVVGDVGNDSTFWRPEEIEDVIRRFDELDEKYRLYLMPFGATDEELKRNSRIVWDLVVKYGLRYSDRLHIRVFGGERRGV